MENNYVLFLVIMKEMRFNYFIFVDKIFLLCKILFTSNVNKDIISINRYVCLSEPNKLGHSDHDFTVFVILFKFQKVFKKC